MARKFENVDVIDALRKIMSHNTRFYQTDYNYDIKTLTDAAAASDDSNRSFLWMSRDSGTWCFPERNVYIEKTHPHNTWLFYRNNPNIKAFWVDLTPMKDGQVRGNLFEIDYSEHVKDVEQNSVMPSKVELLFRNPNNIHTFDYEEYNENWLSIGNRYGTLSEIKYLVPNERYLLDVIYNAKEAYFAFAEPYEIDGYVQEMIKEHFHGRGYTADDMAYVIPDDVYNALKYGIPAYGLYPGNITQQILSSEEARSFYSDNILFGIRHEDKWLLDYLVDRPNIKSELFNHEELKQLYVLTLQIGKLNNLEEVNTKVLDGIINKLEKLLHPLITQEHEEA
jgi:hypothetical protein